MEHSVKDNSNKEFVLVTEGIVNHIIERFNQCNTNFIKLPSHKYDGLLLTSGNDIIVVEIINDKGDLSYKNIRKIKDIDELKEILHLLYKLTENKKEENTEYQLNKRQSDKIKPNTRYTGECESSIEDDFKHLKTKLISKINDYLNKMCIEDLKFIYENLQSNHIENISFI